MWGEISWKVPEVDSHNKQAKMLEKIQIETWKFQTLEPHAALFAHLPT